MSSTPREVLTQIVVQYGDELIGFPRRCEGLLKDFCIGSGREIDVLVACLRSGLIEQLRRREGPSVKLDCARLAMKLEQSETIPGDLARWGVESWAIALRLMTPEAATARVSPLVDPRTPTKPLSWPLVETRQPALPAEIAPPESKSETPSAGPKYIAEEPVPRWFVPDWSRPGETFVVFSEAEEQRPTLQEALAQTAPGDCLLLKPGVHRAHLVVKHNLQIRSQSGNPRDVILEGTDNPVVVLEGASLRLHGLTLRSVVGSGVSPLSAVQVVAGHLQMEDCDLTSDSSTVVEVRGAQADAFLRRCHLHHGADAGISFTDEAAGYLHECHLYENRSSQVVIGKGSSPTLSACKISHAAVAGIEVRDGGGGLIENADIWGSTGVGIHCLTGGKPTVRYSRISTNAQGGILVTEQGEGLFEHCQVFGNTSAGVAVRQGGKPRFSACQIFDNHGEGVTVSEQSEAELLDCEIFNNDAANVLVQERSDPRLHRCVIHDSKKEGAQIVSGSEGRFEQCEFFANALAGVLVAQSSRPIFNRCVFHHGGEKGSFISESGEGQFVDCEWTQHTATAVLVDGRSQPRFERCHIRENLDAGLHVDEASSPSLESCFINENKGVGFFCTRGGAPKMSGGEIGDNGGGLILASEAKGHWEKVLFIGNVGDSVQVSDGARPALRACRIEEARGTGVHFLSQGQGMFEEVTITGSKGAGIVIEGGASPTLKKVRVLNGQSDGIVVEPHGGGSADGCDVRDNAGGNWKIAPDARITGVGY